jgi:hypothetical protein
MDQLWKIPLLPSLVGKRLVNLFEFFKFFKTALASIRKIGLRQKNTSEFKEVES